MACAEFCGFVCLSVPEATALILHGLCDRRGEKRHLDPANNQLVLTVNTCDV